MNTPIARWRRGGVRVQIESGVEFEDQGDVFRGAVLGIAPVAMTVGGGFAFAFGGDRASGFCSVEAGCFALFFCSHGGLIMGYGGWGNGWGLGRGVGVRVCF